MYVYSDHFSSVGSYIAMKYIACFTTIFIGDFVISGILPQVTCTIKLDGNGL